MASGTKKRIVWSVSITMAVVLLFGIFGPPIQYKKVTRWICPISGSTRNEITWFGYFHHEERTVSALEKWLKRKEPGFEPNWKNYSEQAYSLMYRSCALGELPEIYQLRPVLDEFVEKSSDEQITALVTVLRNNSREEQSQMIDRITDRLFAETASVKTK